MIETSEFLLTIGALLLLGLMTSALAERTRLPRVTLLLLFGILIGPQVLNLIPEFFVLRFDMVADMTLLMVGFLLGGKLTRDSFSDSAREIIVISLSAAVIALLLVTGSLLLIGIEAPVAIILGCIATATAPAAILDVVEQTAPQSRFSKLLLLIVAVDDLWALLLFGIGMAIAGQLNGHADTHQFLSAVWEIIGALLLGLALGLPSAVLTGRIKKGQPMLIEALGIVAVCGGLAIYFELSYLIAAMVMGSVIANLAKHHEYPFHAIEGVEGLFMLVFFVLAGASLDLFSLKQLGVMGSIYIVSRMMGKILGACLGSVVVGSSAGVRKWMGLALTPQAGVSIGLALVASNRYPEYQQVLLSVVIASTVLFELTGPVMTKYSIEQANRET